MKQYKGQKPANRIQGLSLLLFILLCIGTLVTATGITFARYQSDKNYSLTFEARVPDQVVLGNVATAQNAAEAETEAFVSLDETEHLTWELVTSEEETAYASLSFAVANGEDSKNFSSKDQAVKLRMYGSPGLGISGTLPELSVTYTIKRTDGTEVEKTVTGEAAALVEGTALYHEYGSGYIYTFYETTAEGKRELSWELAGGKLSYVSLMIKTTAVVSDGSVLLQPIITAETIDY